MLLRDGLTSGKRVELWIHHLRVRHVLSKPFLGNSFPQELNEDKVRKFLILKKDSLSVHEHRLNFIQQSRYAPQIVCGYME